MIRGTTAQYKLKLPYPMPEVAWLSIRFWQPHNPSALLPIVKREGSCATLANPNEVCVSLTAEETARFSDQYKAKLQLRGQHRLSGAIFGNKPVLLTVYPMDDKIIEYNPTLPEPGENEFVIFDGDQVNEWIEDDVEIMDADAVIAETGGADK